ncbi:alpha/beta hydrolase family protein [Nocardia thailandica]
MRAVRWSVRGLVGVLLLTAVGCGAEDAGPLDPVVGSAPTAFYSTSPESLAGEHGSVIKTQPLTGAPAIPGARNQLVLYRSVDAQGKPVAVSGLLAVPAGTPPAGGWPLISWAPGTTGVADKCAASRDDRDSSPVRDLQAIWIAAGYAVAQTDYQGLGTAGEHGYLIGETEQRAVADMATAARSVDSSVGRRWVAMGHSQGGHAALFAASAATAWAPRSELLGVVALAPAAHLGEQVRVAKLAAASPVGGLGAGDLAVFVPLLVRGAQTVGSLDTSRFLTDKASSLLPLADSECTGGLRDKNRWGGLSPRDVFTKNADLGDFLRVLDTNDPSSLRFDVPVMVRQGGRDLTVTPQSTEAMLGELKLRGQHVDYEKYDGVDHGGILAASYDDVRAWVDARFGISR